MEDEGRPPERDEDSTAEEEAAAAAKEAGEIGGPGGNEDADPAERPVAEGGGGQAEGFEEAESDLVEHASHGDPAPDPSAEEQISREEPHPEGGDDARAGADRNVERAHGAGDRVHSTEREDEEQTH